MSQRRKTENEVVREADDLTGRGAELSLSVDDTNKLRISLGLAPLAIKSAAEIAEEKAREEKAREQMKKEAEEDALRLELEKRKHKRLLNAKVAGLSLGEELKLGPTATSGSAASWVERSRQLSKIQQQQEKEKANVREKMLNTQDELFDETSGPSYSSTDLAGMKVSHTAEQFAEGHNVILTLKDQPVLGKDDMNAEEDELESIALREMEQRDKNELTKKQKKSV